MFFEASRYNQSLCAWGELLPSDTNVSNMFSATSCADMKMSSGRDHFVTVVGRSNIALCWNSVEYGDCVVV
jgi:hypothetical protein